MKVFRALYFVAMLLVVVGALNWGLVGFFGFDLVNYLLGSYTPADKIVYDMVGVSAVFVIISCLFCCCGCKCGCGKDCKCTDGCCTDKKSVGKKKKGCGCC